MTSFLSNIFHCLGWMELLWPFDDSEDSDLSVGENATLLVRLKQAENHDTMLSSCSAHSGFQDNKKFPGEQTQVGKGWEIQEHKVNICEA